MAESFSKRLTDAVLRRHNPVVVGLDPRFANLPFGLTEGVNERDRSAVAAAYLEFCRGVIDVVVPLVPAVKPQAAFFEQLGPAGMTVLEATVRYAREKGLLVILDGKRNDIGSTAIAYAEGYLGPPDSSSWGADALTVSPYLGDDSLTPFMDVAVARGAGIFVLVKTSNPGGATFQDLVAQQQPVYRYVADWVQRQAAATAGTDRYGCVGAVVGATWPEQLAELRQAMPQAWLLVPGFGSQGGGPEDVREAFDQGGLGALINSSRAIIFAHSRPEYKDQYGDAQWQRAVEEAALEMIQQMRTVIP